ncbi:C6 transcription factor [Fusarium phyllophilum]|uniref:C6 transcription factor n=1 Tax=Fusarium phyllophilum TaxID=47803 RepID=A0A8H5MTH8_9HYPO|nr:C6 transcription factor [Fusarium phyllophilum]
MNPPPLPPFELCKELYNTQHAYIGTIFAFLQPEDFLQRLRLVYNQELDLTQRDGRLYLCQVLLVLAFGQMYSINRWTSPDGPPGFDYFKAALDFLPDIHERSSLRFIEVLACVTYYMQTLGRQDAASTYIGVAMRMALFMGLHQDVAGDDMDVEENRQRREVWWSLYSLDRILSIKSGNLITIRDEDITTPFPKVDPRNPNVPWYMLVMLQYTELSRILGKIGLELCRRRPKSTTTLLASVQDIMNSLSSWARSVPERLRIDPNSTGGDFDGAAVSVYLLFYSCVAMNTRPILLYLVQQRIDVKTSIITIMEKARKLNLIATSGYLDGEYAFSATLLLIMANTSLPNSPSTDLSVNQGLGILASMAERGNSNVTARR